MQQGEQVLVQDFTLFVRQRGELVVQLTQRGVVHLVAELPIAPLQRVSARVLAQHQARARDPHLFRADDLVREPVLQHAVLVDPRFVGEGVAADHGLVGLGKDTDHVGQELARPEQLLRVHPAVEGDRVRPHASRHDDLFQRRIAGTFTDAVDGAFDLSGSRFDRGERVGHREPEVVMAVCAEYDAVGVGNPLAHGAEHGSVLDG